jgi:hypothetical protein
MHSTASTSPPRDTSIFRMLFAFAYNRIWRGRFLPIAETVLWSIVALRTALALYYFTPPMLDALMWEASKYGFLIITPLLTGWSILKAHVKIGTADASLRIVPITPWQVLSARFSAIMLTWIQLVAPFVFITLAQYWIFQYIYNGPWIETPLARMARDILLLLLSDLSTEFRYGSPLTISYEQTLVSILGILMLLGFGALPVTWGLWWGTRFQHKGGPFLLAFAAYIIFPVAYYLFIRKDYLSALLPRGLLYWAIVFLSGLGGIVLSIIFFTLALKEWARRSG